MILTGKEVADSMIEGMIDVETQTQPNGLDMTLLKVEAFLSQSSGVLDFSNERRVKPEVSEVPFDCRGMVHLNRGCFLITLDPKMKVPLNCMGHLYPRSSLVRMGCSLEAGLFDSGFIGRGQVLLTVKNPAGVKLYKDARVAQMVYHTVEGGDVSEGYSGVYQESDDDVLCE